MTITPKPTSCKDCGARIFFCRSAKSDAMPVDLLPSSNGNLSINEGKDGVLEAVVLTLGQAAGMRAAGLPTFTSHFVGCPGADTFRRRALTKNSRRIR